MVHALAFDWSGSRSLGLRP